jgi:hypothetical protein
MVNARFFSSFVEIRLVDASKNLVVSVIPNVRLIMLRVCGATRTNFHIFRCSGCDTVVTFGFMGIT